jgi:hypothetical protein
MTAITRPLDGASPTGDCAAASNQPDAEHPLARALVRVLQERYPGQAVRIVRDEAGETP